VRKAVLDVLERRDGMTTIAYENGFSSPSHFAFEVKQLLGISPRRFQVRLD
jgi:AraC-like DNA-binding protein